MTFGNALRAEMKRAQVSPTTLVALVLALLVGSGMASLMVGNASLTEENYWMLSEQSLLDSGVVTADPNPPGEEAADTQAAAEVVEGEEEWELGRLIVGEDGQKYFGNSDSLLTCANDDCTRVIREFPLAFEDLSVEAGIPSTALLAVVAVGFALLFVGSDAGNGAMSTQLTFTPHRGRLFAAKSVVAGAGGFGLMLIGHVVGQSILLVGFIAQRGYQDVGTWPDAITLIGRSLALGLALGAAAAFVVFLGGDARVAAALAVGAAAVSYFTLPWGITYYTASSAFWAIMNPMVAMMAIIDPPVIIEYVDPRSYEVTGAITMGLSHAWLVTAGWLVLLGTLGYLRFTRRDIKD